MTKLKAFGWFAVKVAAAVIVIEIVDELTGIVSKTRETVRGLLNR